MAAAGEVPQEGARGDGFGLPVTPPFGSEWIILLDGMPIEHVVAYSVPRGLVWRLQVDSNGRLVRKGDSFASEKLDGEVRIVRRGAMPAKNGGAR